MFDIFYMNIHGLTHPFLYRRDQLLCGRFIESMLPDDSDKEIVYVFLNDLRLSDIF